MLSVTFFVYSSCMDWGLERNKTRVREAIQKLILRWSVVFVIRRTSVHHEA